MADNATQGTAAAEDAAGSAPPKQPTPSEIPEAQPGEATLLVSEFPPPPFYYRQVMGGGAAGAVGMGAGSFLEAPPIPQDALERGTVRAAAAAEKARAESERLRLMDQEVMSQEAILAGTAATTTTAADATSAAAAAAADQQEGNVVAVFGEIVEDPVLLFRLQPLADRCEDPRVVRDEVKRLNNEVVSGFIQLVQDLVHRPMENKKTRDALSHNVFLMLQECNKFREHQARETLIELLEMQLEARKGLLKELQDSIEEADSLLRSD